MTEKIVSTLQHIHDYSRQQLNTKAQHLFILIHFKSCKNDKLGNCVKLELLKERNELH